MRDGELCHDDPITIRAEARIQVNDAEAQSVSRLIGLSPEGRPLTLAMVLICLRSGHLAALRIHDKRAH